MLFTRCYEGLHSKQHVPNSLPSIWYSFTTIVWLSQAAFGVYRHSPTIPPIMNTRPAIDESTGPVSLSVAFNQDSSCFSVGLDTGFCGRFCSLRGISGTYPRSHLLLVFNSEPCELKVSRGTASQRRSASNAPTFTATNWLYYWLDFNAGIGVACLLGKANYVALVGGGRQPKFPQNKVGKLLASIPQGVAAWDSYCLLRSLYGMMPNRKLPLLSSSAHKSTASASQDPELLSYYKIPFTCMHSHRLRRSYQFLKRQTIQVVSAAWGPKW